MPTEAEINAVLDNFFGCLTPQACSILSMLPQNAINQEQSNILHQYFQRFGGTQSIIQLDPGLSTTSRAGSNITDGFGEANSTGSSELSGLGQPAKKPRGRPKDPEKQGTRSTKDDPWFSVRGLTSLILEEALQDHLNVNSANDPVVFLNSCRQELTITPTQDSVPNMDILASYCKTVNTMQGDQVMIHTQWLFLALGVGDMAYALFGKGAKISKKHKDEFMKAAGTDRNAKSSYIMLTAGWNVAFICDQLGTGSLFWLSMTLTAHFVAHRVTKSGGAFEAAMRTLQSLKLTEHIERSGANLLGDAIRAHLKEANKVHQINNVVSNGEDDSGYNSVLS